MLSNQEVVDFVTQRIGQAMEPEDICEELMTRWVVINLVQSKEKKCCAECQLLSHTQQRHSPSV